MIVCDLVFSYCPEIIKDDVVEEEQDTEVSQEQKDNIDFGGYFRSEKDNIGDCYGLY